MGQRGEDKEMSAACQESNLGFSAGNLAPVHYIISLKHADIKPIYCRQCTLLFARK